MNSTNSLAKAEDEEMVLYEAPSGSIPQQETPDDPTQENATSRDSLLSSFDADDLNSIEGSKTFDTRLGNDIELDDITRNIRDATFNAEAPTTSNTGTSGPSLSSQATQFNMQTIGSRFNILDRLSFFQTAKPTGIVGRGSENDGVFSNMSAKPDGQPQIEGDKPPTYDEAAADATPPYWENSILTPGFNDEVFVDGLPVGNIINFIWNLLVSSSFQFVGFLLTYILHTSHAAKQGSRAGLGITFITYAYSMIPTSHSFSENNNVVAASKVDPSDPNNFDLSSGSAVVEGSVDDFHSTLSAGIDLGDEQVNVTKVYLFAAAVALFGSAIIFKAFRDYHRARKMEETILAPPTATAVSETSEQPEMV